MPGASGVSLSLAATARRCPSTRSISARGKPPGRSSVGSPMQETMVDSTPTAHGPASITMSMRPRRSASTCAGVVGEMWPERLAEGATTGPPKASSNAWATGCAGTRTATLSSPASARSAIAAIRLLRQHQRQRPRPEDASEFFRHGIEAPEPARGGGIGDMRDQRIECRASLGGIEPRYCLAVASIGAEPVDRLGGEGHQPARVQAARRSRDALGIGLHYARSRLGSHPKGSNACGLRRAGLYAGHQSECSAVW